MKNREKFQKEILDITCNGENIAKINGKIVSCNDIKRCYECEFYEKDRDCISIFKEWCNQEYQEVDWLKVKVGTPVLVRDLETEDWNRRYFAYVDNENIIHTFISGRTEWSSHGETVMWKYAKLAFPEMNKTVL